MRPAGTVSLVCAETEWHTLPARLATAWLRIGGWDVDFLGGSLPASVLVEDLRRRRPDLVAVSCSVPDRLFGARRTIAAAATVGLPVLAGGAAFGSTEHRAKVLGASAWAAGSTAIGSAAASARDAGGPPPVDPRLELAALEVISHQERLLSATIEALRARFPRFLVPGAPGEAQTIDDVRSIIRFAAAAVLVADESVFSDFIGWLGDILEVRSVPISSLDAGLEALSHADAPAALVPILEMGRRRIASGG